MAKMIAGAKRGAEKKNEFLRLISGGKKLTIDAIDGKEVIANANSIFAYIDSDFRNWETNKSSQETVETEVCVYEIIKDANLSQIFGNPEKLYLYLTQSQIIGFVKKHSGWLQTNGYATLFLFKSHNQFFVAYVHVLSDGKLDVDVNLFVHPYVWHAILRHRIVLPQLA